MLAEDKQVIVEVRFARRQFPGREMGCGGHEFDGAVGPIFA
jgi:hypothetical protein